MADETQRTIARAIGLPLRKVMATVHVFEGQWADDEPLELWLSFEGIALIHVFGAPDGEHLRMDKTPPEPIDMQESGEIVLTDVSRRTVFGDVIGRKLEEAWLVESPPGEVIGLRFDFGLPLGPVIFNWGDELYVVDDYPPGVRGEGISEVRIRPAVLR